MIEEASRTTVVWMGREMFCPVNIITWAVGWGRNISQTPGDTSGKKYWVIFDIMVGRIMKEKLKYYSEELSLNLSNDCNFGCAEIIGKITTIIFNLSV